MERSAHREAAACFEQAIEALEHLLQQPAWREPAIDLHFDASRELLMFGERAKSIDHARRAEALAESLGDERRLGQALVFLAARTQNWGDPDRGLELARRALAIAIGLGDASLQSSANFQLAVIVQSTGDFRESAEAVGRVVEALGIDRRSERLGGATLGSVSSRGRLAWCLAELGDFTEATAHAEEAVRIASEGGHFNNLAFSYRSLGFVFLRRGAIPQAIPPLERAVELCRVAVRILFDIATAHLGYAYALSGRLPEGVALLEEALADPESTGTAFHPLLLAYLGEAHLLAGRPDDARAVARRALDLAHRQKERGNEAWVLRLLGEIALRSDPLDAEAAERHYRDALARAEELGMRPLVAHCHLGLGQLSSQAADHAKARPHLTAAAGMYREMEMARWLAPAEAELGRLG